MASQVWPHPKTHLHTCFLGDTCSGQLQGRLSSTMPCRVWGLCAQPWCAVHQPGFRVRASSAAAETVAGERPDLLRVVYLGETLSQPPSDHPLFSVI